MVKGDLVDERMALTLAAMTRGQRAGALLGLVARIADAKQRGMYDTTVRSWRRGWVGGLGRWLHRKRRAG